MQTEKLVADRRVPLISATGSCRMGRRIGEVVAGRLGRSLLELGGNNAAIVCASADLSVALPAIVFAAAGTAGQRCTSTRRVLIHRSIYGDVITRIQAAYDKLAVGYPLSDDVRVGPLLNEHSFTAMQLALQQAKAVGAKVWGGDRVNVTGQAAGFYVRPALVEMPSQINPMLQETFAPILYALPFDSLDQAIALNNAASHGLSSAIFSTDLRECELFLSASGSDCGIANVNTGTSGAEIGGAFGGEKDTGGGRESGYCGALSRLRRHRLRNRVVHCHWITS